MAAIKKNITIKGEGNNLKGCNMVSHQAFGILLQSIISKFSVITNFWQRADIT